MVKSDFVLHFLNGYLYSFSLLYLWQLILEKLFKKMALKELNKLFL